MAGFNEKSKTAYNRKADDYENSREGRFTREFQRLLVENIALQANQSVLDVACGTGSLLALLNRKTPIKGYGIDLADQMIKKAAANNPDMEFQVAGCEAIPFPDASMDILTVCAAYHHFPDTAAFAKEARRVLRPKGYLYIAEIYLPSFLRVIANPFVPLMPDGDVRFYSPKQIINIHKPYGFERAEVKILGHIQIVVMKKL